MRLNLRATTAIVSALPSCRVLLLVGAVLVMSESLALATTMFAASALSFAASLVLAAKLYRSTTPLAREATRPNATPGNG